MMYKYFIISIVVYIFLLISGFSQTRCYGSAKWITISNFEHGENQWFNLRKSIHLHSVPKYAKVKISVDSKYWLWINGKLVINEGMVKRGPTPHDTYFDEIDLVSYLNKGNNTIAVLVWYFGKEGFSHKDSGKFGFYFDGLFDDKNIVSDKTWKIVRNSAYGSIQEGKPANFRLPESNVKYIAYNEIQDWQKTDFDDSLWQNAQEVGEIGVSPWNNLIKRDIPQWKDFGLIKTTDFLQDGQRVILNLPYNMQFSYWLKVKSKKGKSIHITTDSFVWLNDTPLRSQYVTTEGIQEYEHLPWLSGHQVYFDLDEGIEVLEVGYRETGFDTKMDGQFVVEDPFLMKLLEKANRTLYVNMRDTYFDCPDRERAQWWGDAVLLMEESYYALDNNVNSLTKKAIYELVNWQKDDGVMFSPIPAGNWKNELPQQILAAIALGIKNYRLYTGDNEVYYKVHSHIKKYLNLWTIEDNGYVNFKSGGWNWSDWGEHIDAELLEHAWYYMALKTYAEISHELNYTEERNRSLAKAARIKEYVNTHYWTPGGYKSSSYNDGIDDRGNGLMVVAGIADVDKYDTISNLLSKVMNSSPYMDKYQLEALFLMNQAESALVRIKSRYSTMVNADWSTLWEVFEPGNWSYNHGWSGGPLTMMYKYMAGIRPTKPGFEQFEVFPQLIDYKSLKCSFSTVKGDISFDYTHRNNLVNIDLAVPPSTEAIIRIPKQATEVKISGGGKYNLLKDKSDIDFNYYVISGSKWRICYNLDNFRVSN